MRFATHVAKATVEPSDHRAELELSNHVVVLRLELNETRNHEIDVGLTPHLPSVDTQNRPLIDTPKPAIN